MSTEVARLVAVDLLNSKGLETSLEMTHEVRFLMVGDWQNFEGLWLLPIVVVDFLVTAIALV